MVDSEKEKVFDSKTQEFSNYKELEQIFDNLLNDSYTLAQKCVLLKEQLVGARKQNEKLRIDNENLFKKNHCLQESHFKLSKQLKQRREINYKRDSIF